MPQQLVSSCVAVASIDAAMRQSMVALFIEHYDGVSCATFLRDLAEKEWAILLHDDRGTLRGFSTLRVYARNVRGVSLRLLFSGDTIIEPTYWGEQTVARAWCDVAGRLAAAEPETPMYWLLLSKGFRTYLYLPLFFAEFWPRRDAGMPSFERAVIDDFASFKYGDCWRPERGVITFDEAPGRLRGELAEIAPHR